ncbi:MAG: hypothetical protein JXB49_29655 [Bacteroidales bacterium]|nr:hypothetical protein [Bacteroidales bacterium]
MKKSAIILIGLLFVSFSIKAQLIIIYTKNSCDATYNDTTSKWNEWKNFTDNELTIKIDSINNTVKIANKAEDTFKLLKLHERDSGTVEIFGKYIENMYIAVDKKGNDCIVGLRFYEKLIDIVPVSVTVFYLQYKFSYLGSIVEF